jgi:hypothetical protein
VQNDENILDKDLIRTHGLVIIGTSNYVTRVLSGLINLGERSGYGNYLLAEVLSGDRMLVIFEPILLNMVGWIPVNILYRNNDSYSSIAFDLGSAQETLGPDDGYMGLAIHGSIEAALAHELEHFRVSDIMSDYLYLLENNTSKYRLPFAPSEILAVQAENFVRYDLGLPLRTHYGGVRVFPRGLEVNNNFPNTMNITEYVDFNGIFQLIIPRRIHIVSAPLGIRQRLRKNFCTYEYEANRIWN